MKNKSLATTLQIILLLILTLFIAYQSVVSARANAWYFSARNIVDRLTENGLEQPALSDAETAINKAVLLSPMQPHYLHMKAFIKVLQFEFQREKQPSASTQHYISEAKEALKLSLSQRTTWSKSWVLMAQVVSIEEGASEQVYSLLKKAKSVGPYDFDVHVAVLHISLNNWSTLSPQFRRFYVDELLLASRQDYNFHKVFQMATDINKEKTLCLSLQFGNEFNNIKQTSTYKHTCKNFV